MLNSTATSNESSAESIVLAQEMNNVSRRLTKSDKSLVASDSFNNKNNTSAALPITAGSDGRETWGKKVEFLLAVIGFAVDLGNVWRFPSVCYSNGGGAFLIPYCIMLIFGGLPLFYMELGKRQKNVYFRQFSHLKMSLGQYYRSGCLTIWRRICPALKGIGYAICIIDLYVGMHYNTIIGWAVYYLIASFKTKLPWLDCENDWNTENCTVVNEMAAMNDSRYAVSPAREYYEREVLNLSPGLDDIGPIKWSLAGCVFVVFILVYFSLWKGVRSSGKAVFVTALAPYFVLFILLGRGLTLPGAYDGISYYLTPDWKKLWEPKIWLEASIQIFFSLGPGFGTLLALSSYNKFHNNCYRDAILTSTINCLTSFLAGFVIFSVLGYMAKVQNKHIKDVGLEGPGLVFIVYPEALAQMPFGNFWSIIFFFMLITLGLDSTFGGLEAIITALCDEYPRILGRHREIFVAGLLVFVFICSLPTCTYGGMYIVNLLNIYGPGISVLFIVFLEATAVSWFYGVERFSEDIEKMIGSKPPIFWTWTWKFVSPACILVMFISSLYNYEHLKSENYTYPQWSIVLGWCLTLSSLICIPIYIVYLYCMTPGTPLQRIQKMVKPIDASDAIIYNPTVTYGTTV